MAHYSPGPDSQSLLPTSQSSTSSTLSPSGAHHRNSSLSAEGEPARPRRGSLSANQSSSPSMPLAAAASVNASMMSGSSGPTVTARDTVESRRRSIVADLALADDRLPPPAEIAPSDRKGSVAVDGVSRTSSLSVKDGSNRGGRTSRSSFSGSPNRTNGSDRQSLNAADPFHRRAPSVGEVHQQMEQEQEAQVNRLLLQIHQQQMQIDALKRQSSSGLSHMISTPGSAGSVSSFDNPLTPTMTTTAPPASGLPPPTPQRAHSSGSASTTAASTMPAAAPTSGPGGKLSTSPPVSPLPRPLRSGSPMSISLPRRTASSRGSSRPTSPSVKVAGGARDGFFSEGEEAKYWQVEAENLGKENDLLKGRVRELERQLRIVRASQAYRGASEGGGSEAMDMETSPKTAPVKGSSLATESMSIDD